MSLSRAEQFIAQREKTALIAHWNALGGLSPRKASLTPNQFLSGSRAREIALCEQSLAAEIRAYGNVQCAF